MVAILLYLPVGMYLVTDWVDYSKDALTHTCRAVAQVRARAGDGAGGTEGWGGKRR
jgi:hypothetical protein